MADETTNEEQQQDQPQPQEEGSRDDEQLGQPGLNALRAERDARKTAERELAAMRDRLHTFLDARSHSLNMPQQRDISPKGPNLRWRPAQD